jgi:hypothetical protein
MAADPKLIRGVGQSEDILRDTSPLFNVTKHAMDAEDGILIIHRLV